MEIFGITLEFDHNSLYKHIVDAIYDNKAGYICVVDGNVLSYAYKHPDYGRIIHDAYVNSCDSSYIAMMANDIYNTNFRSLKGPTIFNHFIEKPFTHLLLGNTKETFLKIKDKVAMNTNNIDNLYYLSLPFASIDEFDYQEIAEEINVIKPDLIWVGLGAPKQEYFMSKLQPFLKKGLMIGIGAAFNYYAGNQSLTEAKIGNFSFIWLQRIFQEPKKQLRRCYNFISVIYPLKVRERNLKRLREK